MALWLAGKGVLQPAKVHLRYRVFDGQAEALSHYFCLERIKEYRTQSADVDAVRPLFEGGIYWVSENKGGVILGTRESGREVS
ncbi:hypothetical protein DSM101010T_20930 [Desulfovibrio subterraneus]|uniref:Uncharacterized protein n=1 Tax=Desulfovibrio subterraneus TaxID=2718620 RepID=A0A7J0BJI3_9BACT|nr:hypothetical protein DSM101010T_20930 [Desulfovibrio subterraneus]